MNQQIVPKRFRCLSSESNNLSTNLVMACSVEYITWKQNYPLNIQPFLISCGYNFHLRAFEKNESADMGQWFISSFSLPYLIIGVTFVTLFNFSRMIRNLKKWLKMCNSSIFIWLQSKDKLKLVPRLKKSQMVSILLTDSKFWITTS